LPAEIQQATKMIAEGLFTARSAQECAKKHRIDTPIINEVVAVLDAGKTPVNAMKELFGRQLRSEEEFLNEA